MKITAASEWIRHTVAVAPHFCCSKKKPKQNKSLPLFPPFPPPKNSEFVSHFLTQMEASRLETTSIQLPNQGPISGLCWSSVLVASVSSPTSNMVDAARLQSVVGRLLAGADVAFTVELQHSGQRPHRRRR